MATVATNPIWSVVTALFHSLAEDRSDGYAVYGQAVEAATSPDERAGYVAGAAHHMHLARIGQVALIIVAAAGLITVTVIRHGKS